VNQVNSHDDDVQHPHQSYDGDYHQGQHQFSKSSTANVDSRDADDGDTGRKPPVKDEVEFLTFIT
jgi:hypothetical protein